MEVARSRFNLDWCPKAYFVVLALNYNASILRVLTVGIEAGFSPGNLGRYQQILHDDPEVHALILGSLAPMPAATSNERFSRSSQQALSAESSSNNPGPGPHMAPVENCSPSDLSADRSVAGVPAAERWRGGRAGAVA